jgi:transposase
MFPSGNRKKYTPEYREQAVRLVVDTGRPVAHVAAEIGVGEQLLGRWVAAAKARSATDNPVVLDDDEHAEMERLRKETPNTFGPCIFEKIVPGIVEHPMPEHASEMFCGAQHMGARCQSFASAVGVRNRDPLVVEGHDPVKLADVGPGIDPTTLEIFDRTSSWVLACTPPGHETR